VWAFGKVLLRQIEKRQSERFSGLDEARKSDNENWDKRIQTLDEHLGRQLAGFERRLENIEEEAKDWARVERDFLSWKAELPMTYVMRDDYVRNQTVIEAKLDSVAVRIENLQLKGVIK
jgi:hypothetical protein